MEIRRIVVLVSAILILFSSLILFNQYLKIKESNYILSTEKQNIKKMDLYHNLDLLLKKSRGLQQINTKSAKNESIIISERIRLILLDLDNNEVKEYVQRVINFNYKDDSSLFYEYTKLINYLNVQKISLFNLSKFIFDEKEMSYLISSVFIYELPLMLENLGKLRGVGSSILSNKEAKDIDIYVLKDNFNSLKLHVKGYMNFINNMNLMSVEKKNYDLDLSYLDNELEKVFKEDFSLDAYEYFLLGTKLIENLNNLYIKSRNHIFNKMDKEKNKLYLELCIYILIYLLFIILIIILSLKTYKQRLALKNIYDKNKYNDYIINKLHSVLYLSHSVKIVSDKSLDILANYLSCDFATMYILDEKNQQLNLVSTYRISNEKVKHILDLDEGNISLCVKNKEIISKSINNEITLIIPIVYEDKTLASVQLYFHENKQIQILSSEILEIISNYIYKAKKDEENLKYFNLIDNYVLTSSTNKKGEITYVSKVLCENSGYEKSELVGKTHSILSDSTFDKKVFKEMWETILNDKTWIGEIRNIKKDGTFYWLKVMITPEYGFYGDIIGFNSIREDITDKKRVEELSITDSLTSLFNRRHFDEIFLRERSIAKREKTIIAFSIIDIDYFKQYNDTYGHDKGDIALKQVAITLKENMKRANDYSFRLGGEEFALLFSIKDEKGGLDVLKRIQNNLALLKIKHEKSEVSSYLTISIGVYFIYADEKNNCNELYKIVDEYLYKAKKTGRNKIVYK